MKEYRWQELAFFSALSIGLAVIALTQVNPRSGIPEPSTLLIAEGAVDWIQAHRYGVRFGLAGNTLSFSYPSKANAADRVESALRGAGTKAVRVTYEQETFKPLMSDREYHDVWEVFVEGRPVRTFAETSRAYEQDNKVAPWLGAAFALSGAFLGYQALRKRNGA